ncbi:MAG: enoyl-CoA hydratase/isomerase family protein [Bradymonadaceae bacterium]
MTDYDTLDIQYEDDGIATLTLRRPDKLNALNAEVLEELHAAADELADDEDLRATILAGEGRAFIAGADVEAMAEMTREEGEAFGRKGHETMAAIEAIPVPTIAAVDGFALGGGLEVALCCDLIYASGRAKFGLPEVSLGIIPGFGGTQRLARFVGWHHARDLVFSARQIGADEAEEIGLVCDCFEVDSFDQCIDEIAETIASRGPLAVRAAKRVMRAGEDLSLEQGLEVEREAFGELFDTDDRVEGMRAFADRRDADFRGE